MKVKLCFVCLVVLVGAGLARPGFSPKDVVRRIRSGHSGTRPLGHLTTGLDDGEFLIDTSITEVIATIRQVAKFGIVLEPVYTAKTFYGMVNELKNIGSRNPLFIHTGGLFGLFPYRQELFADG